MTTIVRNHHVLAVPSVAASAKFYTSVMGFREVLAIDGWRFVARDNCVFMLGECLDALPVQELGDHSYVVCLVVDDAEAYLSAMQEVGVELTQGLADKPWRMREFGIRTPDGHRIMIGQGLD